MFDNTVLNTDFERSSGFGRYELQGSRTDFVGEFGGTVVSQSGDFDSLACRTVEQSLDRWEPRVTPPVSRPSSADPAPQRAPGEA